MTKRFVALILSTICMLLFTGCSSEELSLMAALQKDVQMTSVKTTELLSGNMKITLPTELQEDMDVNLQSILNMLSSFRLEATTQQKIQGETATAAYQYAIISDDMNFSGEIYASVDNNQTKTILKIPTPFKALLPRQYENATYLTIDAEDLWEYAKKTQEWSRLNAQYYGRDYIEPEAMPETIPQASISDSLQLGNNVSECLKNYVLCMADTPNIVTKTNNTYSLVMSDQDFKALLRSAVMTYFDNPEARAEIENLWNAITTYYSTIYPEEIVEDLPALPQLPEDPDAVSQMRLGAEIILTLLENVRLVGEDGIRVTFTVNSQGYITEINADIHLDFDINAITKLSDGTADYEEDFAFEIRLHYNQKRYDINNVQTISIPTLTEENNLPIYKLLADTVQEEIDWVAEKLANGETYENEYDIEADDVVLPAADGSISIVYESKYNKKLLNFDEAAPLLNENGTLYVPLEALMYWLGTDYGWDEDTKTIFFSDPLTRKMTYYYPGDNVMYSEDYAITLAAPTLVKDGQDYLPLRAMISAFSNYKIRWSAEDNAAYISPWHYTE